MEVVVARASKCCSTCDSYICVGVCANNWLSY